MLSAHPDAKVIIDYAAEMGNAISQELKRRNKTNIVHVTSDGNDAMIPLLKEEDGAYTKGDRWFSPGDQGVVSVKVLRARIENDEDPTNENIGVEGFTIVPGTKDPIVIKTRQELATAENIDSLPPFGYNGAREQDPVRRLMGMSPMPAPADSALQGLGKEYVGRAGTGRRLVRHRARVGPRPRGGERRRQVDADQADRRRDAPVAGEIEIDG